MPLPTARMTDMTPTGDPIVGPCVPTVLVAGLPASVIGDLVSGPTIIGNIVTPSPTVLFGGIPAARMTSTVVGVHPITGVPVTNVIMVPCATTVLIP